jgi:hypothetical protein
METTPFLAASGAPESVCRAGFGAFWTRLADEPGRVAGFDRGRSGRGCPLARLSHLATPAADALQRAKAAGVAGAGEVEQRARASFSLTTSAGQGAFGKVCDLAAAESAAAPQGSHPAARTGFYACSASRGEIAPIAGGKLPDWPPVALIVDAHSARARSIRLRDLSPEQHQLLVERGHLSRFGVVNDTSEAQMGHPSPLDVQTRHQPRRGGKSSFSGLGADCGPPCAPPIRP